MNDLNDQPSIAVHIEELVLHGFAPGNRYEIAAAVQQELVRLLSERRISPVSVANIEAGAFAVPQGTRTERIGAQIAKSIHGGISHNEAQTAQKI